MSRTAVPNEPPRRRHGLSVLLVVLGVLGYEGMAHWVATSGGVPGARPLFTLAPLLVLLCWGLWRRSRVWGLTAILVLLIGLLAVLRMHLPLPDLKLLYAAPHIIIDLLLLWFFGRTLRAGHVSLVTRIARHEHGSLPPEIELYTRRVTWAWCIYFGLMAAVSSLLFVFAPLPVWSWFANMLSLPLILLMFAGEYAYRIWRFPNFSHASFFTAIRSFRELRRASVIPGR